MGYWKSKVLPKIKMVFEKNGTKKAAAAEASKSFDDSKEEYNKAFEENKTELQSKVVEIYEASSTEIKSLVKERDEAGLKKNFKAVNNFLEELVKIDFPGSKAVSEASSKFGPALVSGPVFYVFEKVSTFIVTEENKEKVEAPPTETKTEEETSAIKEREIVTVGEEKKEEEKSQVVETTEKTESSTEPPKVEEEQPSKEEEKPAEPVAVEKAEQPEVTKVEEQPGTEPSKVEEKPAEPVAVEKEEPPKP